MGDGLRRLKDSAAKYYARGKYDKALLAWQKVVEKDPADLSSRLRLGDVYRRVDQPARAVSCYREVAGFYARDGLLLKAIAACRLILEVESDHTDTQALLADLYARKYGHPPPPERPLPERVGPRARAVEAGPEPGQGVADGIPAPAPAGPPPDEDPPAAAGPDADADEVLIVAEVDTDGDDDDEILLDLDALGDEPIDVSAVEPPPLPPAPEPRVLPEMALFSDLDRDAFIALMEQMDHRRLDPGEVVVRQGEQGDAFFVVADGTLVVTREVGGETLELARLDEGHFFGEMALLSDAPRSATVTCETPVELFELDRALLEHLAADHPSVQAALERFYRQRLLANLMATSPIFRPFDRAQRRALVQRFNALTVPAGEAVVEEGQPSGGLYLVMSGEVAVTRGAGFEEETLARLHEGDVFGEMSVLGRQSATATVRMLREGVLLRLPTEAFNELIMTHPQILEVVSELTEARSQANAARAGGGPGLELDPGDLLV